MPFDDDNNFQKIVQQNIVVPKFYQKVWTNAKIIELDLQNNELAKLMDYYGCDKLLDNGETIVGLSQRIQRVKFATYKSITIRRTRIRNNNVSYSEYYKTLRAIESNAMTSLYQSHCYVNANDESATDIVWGIIVRKPKLYQWLSEHPEKVYRNIAYDDNSSQTFSYVYGKDLPKEVLVAIYSKGTIEYYNQLSLF